MKSLSSHIKKSWNIRNWISNALHHRSMHFSATRAAVWASPTIRWRNAIRLIQKEIRRRSDLQLLILCKNWSNSKNNLLECWIFSAWQDTDDLFVNVFRTKTKKSVSYQDKKWAWTQSSIKAVPKSGLTMSEHANVMSKTESMHYFWRFYRECNTSFQVLEGDNRALARQNNVQARCKFSPRTPASWA